MATRKGSGNLDPGSPMKPWGSHIRDEVDRITGKAKVYDKQAADAQANRLESEAEVQAVRNFDKSSYSYDKSAVDKKAGRYSK